DRATARRFTGGLPRLYGAGMALLGVQDEASGTSGSETHQAEASAPKRRRLPIFTKAGFSSMPRNSRPVRSQTMPVVADPANGSRTTHGTAAPGWPHVGANPVVVRLGA